MKQNRICQVCGKPFYARLNAIKKGYGKYCTMACYSTGSQRGMKRFCEICNKELYVIPSVIKRGGGKFCSKECYGIANAKRQKGPNNPYWKPYKVCEFCGKEYKGRKYQKFCSCKCVGRSKSRHYEIKKKCKMCGKIFPSRPISHRIFCSATCQHKYMRKDKIHNWKGGFSKGQRLNYKTERKYKIWREEVYERNNYTCQYCLARSKEGEQVYLEAHHIKSWAKYPKLRFKISNGRTLCRSCHRIETNRQMKEKK